MTTPGLQLKGNLMLGPVTADTDVSEWVTKFTLQQTRTSIAIPATLATGQDSQAAGAAAAALELDFFSDFGADSIWDILMTAIATDTSELLFSGTLDPGAVSATNPEWSGTITVLGVATGGTVGGLRTQSLTFPVKAGTLAKTITP